MATRIKKTRTFSKGCALQVLGLPLPFVGALIGPVGSIVGTIAMLVMVFIGAKMSTTWYCGQCNSPITGRRTRSCPKCRARFD